MSASSHLHDRALRLLKRMKSFIPVGELQGTLVFRLGRGRGHPVASGVVAQALDHMGRHSPAPRP
jgi:hypothetical protein